MTDTQDNKLVVGSKETKEVLTFVITLVMAIKNAKEDNEITWTDARFLFPVLFTIGPAIENIENIEGEMKLQTVEEANELKIWVREQVSGLDDDIKLANFIKDAFVIVLDIWMLLKVYILNIAPTIAPTTEGISVDTASKTTENPVE